MFEYFNRIKYSVIHSPHKHFVHGMFWSFSGNFLSQFISFLILVILARYWGKVGYGQFGIIMATVTFCSELAGIGLGITSTKYISQSFGSDKKIVGSIIGSTFIIGSISALLFSSAFFILSPQISTYYLNIPQRVFELRISSVLLLITAINGITASILFGFEQFKAITFVNLIRSLLAIPVTLLGVHYLGLSGAIYALIFLSLLQFFIQGKYILKTVKKYEIVVNYNLKIIVLKRIIKFSAAIFITNIVVSFALWLSNLIIVHQVGGIGEVGIVNVANQWRGILTFLPGVIIQVLLPLLSGNLEDENREDYDRALTISFNIIILIIFPLCSLLMLFTPLITSLYGSTYKNSELALVGIFFSALQYGIVSFSGPVLQSREKLWSAFLFNLSWGIILTGLMLLFSTKFGASSYTFGSALAYMISSFLLFKVLVKNLFPKDLQIRMISAIFSSLLIASLCVINLYHPSLILTILIVLVIIISTYLNLDLRFRLNLKKVIIQSIGKDSG